VSSLVVWQGGPALQVGLDLLGVRPEGALDLLVEVRVAVVDEVDVLVRMHRPGVVRGTQKIGRCDCRCCMLLSAGPC